MAGFHAASATRYAEAIRHSGLEALAFLTVADRLADAERDAAVRVARSARPRTLPVVVGLGTFLVRVGGRLEAAATPKQQCECAYSGL